MSSSDRLHRLSCQHSFPSFIDADLLPKWIAEKINQARETEKSSRFSCSSSSSPPSFPSSCTPVLPPAERFPFSFRCSQPPKAPQDIHPFLHPEITTWKAQSLKDEILSMIISFFIMGCFAYLPIGLSIFYRRYCTKRRRKIIFWLAVVLIALIPLRKSLKFRRWRGWTLLHHYHNMTAVLDAAHELPPRKPTIYPILPHGIVPFAPAALCTMGFSDILQTSKLVVASVVAKIPFYGHICHLLGCVAASKSEMMKLLVEKKENLVLIPGGIAEMYASNSDSEVAYLKNRKGFIKLAIETGCSVVPIYCFGNSKSFKLFPGCEYLQPLSRILKVSLLMFFGRFGLPVPFKVPMLYAVGRQMSFGEPRVPTDDDLNKAHTYFLDEVKLLFDKYKHLYGWSTKTLLFE